MGPKMIISALFFVFICLSKQTTVDPIIIIHGGAGDVKDERIPGILNGIRKSVKTGYAVLANGGCALDAVEAAVRAMEDDENFNAGHGSVVNIEGEVEMDAGIMDGRTLDAGALAIVKDIANPISLARLVMEKTPHVVLGAHGATKFAKEQGVPILPPGSLVTDFAKKTLEELKQIENEFNKDDGPQSGGTVGAVAVDKYGNVAAATSTGGTRGKMVGRIGDTPVLGGGTYADNEFGAVSATGHGETIMKYCLAHSIIKEMELGRTAAQATENSIEAMKRKLKNFAGAITLSKDGDVGIYHSSRMMSWAYQRGNKVHYGINKDEDNVEVV